MTANPTSTPTNATPPAPTPKGPLILAIVVGIVWIGIASRLGVVGTVLSVAGIVALIALKAKLPAMTPRKTSIGILVFAALLGLQARPHSTPQSVAPRPPVVPPTQQVVPPPASVAPPVQQAEQRPAPVESNPAVTKPSEAPPTAPVVTTTAPNPPATATVPATPAELPHPNQYLVDGMLAAFPGLKQIGFMRDKEKGNAIRNGVWRVEPWNRGIETMIVNPGVGLSLFFGAPSLDNRQGDGGADTESVIADAGKAISIYFKGTITEADAIHAVRAAMIQHADQAKKLGHTLNSTRFTVLGQDFVFDGGTYQTKGVLKGALGYNITCKTLRE